MTTVIDVTQSSAAIHTLDNFTEKPNDDGVLTELDLALPPTKSVCHFTAFQRHDPMHQSRPHQAIGGGANRVQGLRITRWDEAIEGGLYAILELETGEWMTLLPVAGRSTLAWLNPHGPEEVGVKVGNLGTDPVNGDIPVLAWSRSEDLYEACQTVWEQVMNHPETRGLVRQRSAKSYPEIFKHLGWCSWEQYKRDISSDLLTDAARRINDSDIPVRFLLVDDGYFRHTNAESAMDNRLVQFGPNPESFPQGWEPLLNQRRDDGIRWFGLWQNFNGYWNCIAEDNDLDDELNAHLMDLPQGGHLPKGNLSDATVWYEAMLNVAREGDFDFVKVDNQSANLHNYQGTGNAVEAATCSSQAFERAAAAQVNGVINCMAHGPVSVSNTCLSAVTRCSEDYELNNAWRAKAHLHNSYQNMLWLGPTVWGDHDMFHSSDTFAGRMMAVSKAVSGGPVYLSDNPDDFNPDHILPLCDDDGRLFRPLAPAVPLPGSAKIDPFEDEQPYVAAAPLSNGAAVIVAYNLTEPTTPVRGSIDIHDYKDAAGLLTRETVNWSEPEEGVIVYDWYNQTAEELTGSWNYQLDELEDRLLLLCPIQHGIAVIGRTDKYLSPATVDVLEVTEQHIFVRSREEGELKVWNEGKVKTFKLESGFNIVTV